LLESFDVMRLLQLLEDVKGLGTEQLLEGVVGPDIDDNALAAILAECTFAHGAILVFPDDVADVTVMLRHNGFGITGLAPSVVVRKRLAQRYAISENDIDVSIVHASIELGLGTTRAVEIFCLPREQATHVMITRERAENNESHTAFEVRFPDTARLTRLRSIFVDQFSMRTDGGGYNPFDDPEAGGRSVLYFDSAHGRRLELTCAGNFPEVIDMHRRSTRDSHHHLLTILSGHWAARAVYTAAKLGVVDVLVEKPRPAEEIARLLDAEADAMARFLRYLAHLGVLRTDSGASYALSPVGELLRAESSFRDLTLLYGEEFHQAWNNFPLAVRSGESAFGITFGAEHFDYFASHPASAQKFDRSMSAISTLVADRISTVWDFSTSSSVVDVGGGNGTLLRAVLRDNPVVSGVLVDRAHVTAGVAVEPDFAGRLTASAGDFFESVPPGHDVYLLARVLHDWNDEASVQILEVCRTACGPNSALLVLERLLPENGGTSLAQAWDMQMLAVTGGRERTRAEYEELLAKAGFVLQEIRGLPLDMNVLVCRPV
jgi:hypothetical protein